MLGGLPILIVEDEALIALDLAAAVEEFDGRVIGPVATVAEALSLLEQGVVAAAVLDANLADRDVTPIALRLIEQVVPFVIHTGTGLPAELAAIDSDILVIQKPSRAASVITRLIGRIGQGR